MIRGLYDTFELDGPSGQHQCLVQPPMHMTALEMMQLAREPFNPPLLKMTLKRLLMAFDFLHTDANIIHGGAKGPVPSDAKTSNECPDLKTDNLMLNIQDPTMLDRFELAELESPSPRKVIDDTRTIYKSRSLPKPKDGAWGLLVLCDFGEAKIGSPQESTPFFQPQIYRAPEIIFEMRWGFPVDIWNLACLVRDAWH